MESRSLFCHARRDMSDGTRCAWGQSVAYICIHPFNMALGQK
jgi:hypothetical protein